jgi:hypothetical protein
MKTTEKYYYCVFTYEGEIVGSIEVLNESQIESYNSVWGINPFATKKQAEEFIREYAV